ncbi:VTT domain-containing protein [Paraburkholderia kirstenboschensis]|uniref:VTT domain-containing protein n=1 Tax=Paraburkholderia kirstenboschensis TaxID=1245436 RepID=A0ABZ0EGH3_9BURK|nr:VTT domain-containing protein [Paraburkholderia kirstenboschensis]WOD16324.1 VTT domain-containing protein [Paraburkholderia kirstenboschensis]
MQLMQMLQIALHFDQHLSSLIVQYGTAVYAMLFIIVFVEIGFLPLFFLPGDPLIFICGGLSATGALNVWLVIPVLFAATVAGSIVDYAIGRAIGEKVYTANYRWLDKNALRRAHAFYEARGGLTFLLSPFIAVVRTFAPFVAGVSRMTFARFVSFVTAGAALWIGSLVAAGYLLGNVPLVRDHMSSIVLLGVALGVGSLIASALWRLVNGRSRVQ